MLRRPWTLRDWVVSVFGLVGLGLLPWALWLSASLQPEHTTDRWDIAWSGFDVGLSLCFLGTAFAAARRSPWVWALAGATGTLLLADAWFDVVLESHGSEELTAILLALCFELPAAAACFWVASLHLAPAAQRATERDLVGVLEVAADGEAAREPRHPDAPA